MRIKRDPESMQAVREILERSPGWYPQEQLNAVSDDELADALDKSFTALEEWVPKVRAAWEETAKKIAQSFKPLAEASRLSRPT